ncbi:SDR family NAD(P)-dependent oxidoreductase [Streptomyces nigrescens]|uniref:SDR family oxidoreductase n=1 Tax=Streptomyces nigrescens TaxID=1920 RepID=A0A640TUQ2_STRNI|nr:SDR family oxidoreductase [Streptomyces libani]WAU01464.1 SDR family oxidoreductase [Streptomyces libani subsp. libani]GFE27407.1 hypothetical protein Sliba_78600 [Streptomyces libani subsp. libani]GGV96224.1 hypothetical protein GCM10010500_38470 [Streptomyces libani subsp. libani]
MDPDRRRALGDSPAEVSLVDAGHQAGKQAKARPGQKAQLQHTLRSRSLPFPGQRLQQCPDGVIWAGQGGGVIVIVILASIAAHAGFRGHAAYAAAKQGVLAPARTAAREYADRGIRVVSVSPGIVDTPMVTSLPPGATDGLLNAVPLRRTAQPAEVAALIAFLVSDDAS